MKTKEKFRLKNGENFDVLAIAFPFEKSSKSGGSRLGQSFLQGDLETIKEIISNHKLTKDAEKNPKIHWDDAVTTPLHLAAGNGHLNIVKFYQETLHPQRNVRDILECLKYYCRLDFTLRLATLAVTTAGFN